MTYATIMVNMELRESNTALLEIAGDLAIRFDAHVIGIAARQPAQDYDGEAGYQAEVQGIKFEAEVKTAETEFRHALRKHVGAVEWRSTQLFTAQSEYIAREARSVDLVATGVVANSVLDVSQGVSTSDLVMQVGRPVLVVPRAATPSKLEHAVVCWKDTREARRAASDALPLLKRAARVTVVEIASQRDRSAAAMRIKDVIAWLERHGITAEPLTVPSVGDDAKQLDAIVSERAADIVVAGAYGHSRLHEWVLGGVTRGLLMRSSRCSLVSH